MAPSGQAQHHTSGLLFLLLLAPVFIWLAADCVQRFHRAQREGTVRMWLSQLLGGSLVAIGGVVLCGLLFMAVFQLPMDEVLGPRFVNYVGFVILGAVVTVLAGSILMARNIFFRRPRRHVRRARPKA